MINDGMNCKVILRMARRYRCLHRNSSHNPAIKNAIPADDASSGHLTAIRRTPLDECDSPRTRLMPRPAPTTLFLWTSSDILANRSQNPLKIHHSWAKFQPQTTIFGPWAQRTSGADTLESRHFFGSPTTADEGDMVFFLKSKGWIPNTPRWKPDATTCVCYSKLIPHVRKHPQKISFSKINGSWPLPSAPDTLESAIRHSQRTFAARAKRGGMNVARGKRIFFETGHFFCRFQIDFSS